jgi:hypothetical protein
MSATRALPATPELAGYRDLWSVVPRDLAERHGIAHLDLAGGVCLGCASQSGKPYTGMLNHAIGLGTDGPVTEHDLDALEDFYAGLGADYAVAVEAADPDLGARLADRGFGEGRPWMTFRRAAGVPPSPRTRLRVVEAGRAEASAFGGTVAAGFMMPPEFSPWMAALVGLPGWTCFLALQGNLPVGAAALRVEGDSAWVTLGATLPEHRGLGAQGALFAARARRAAELGARRLVTETGAPLPGEGPGPSYRNILRAGFEEAGLRPNLESPR